MMLKFIDALLNRITMYRLTLYYLITLIIAAIAMSFFGVLPYNPYDIALNTIVVTSSCLIANYIFAKLFHASTNTESVYITALILTLIIPVQFPANVSFFIAASIFAMGSKYLLTIEKRHVFNPAAAAIAGIALLSPEHAATWWVGTTAMLPFVVIGGLLVTRKIRRESLVVTFLSVYLLLITLASLLHHGSIASLEITWRSSTLHSALFFFAFVMLTEPLTTPGTAKLQKWYAAFVAFLYATLQINIPVIAFTPEMALCVGNVFSYIVSPNVRLFLPLIERQQLTPDTYAFLFKRPQDFRFTPGQYMEWTLPHPDGDNRGNRRYFSLASSPTENTLAIAVKFYTPSSSYKKALLSLKKGQPIIASQVAGDFVLPKNLDTPLVFIAGGIGIAPFRSCIQYILDTNLRTNIVLLYSNRTVSDIAYSDVFKRAEPNGVRTIYTLSDAASVPPNWPGRVGLITEETLKADVPDYGQRTFYISGPQGMVKSYESMLKGLGIHKSKIITDYFPGYVE